MARVARTRENEEGSSSIDVFQTHDRTLTRGPDDPDWTCVEPGCGLNGEDGALNGRPMCGEHLADYLVDEPLAARATTDERNPIRFDGETEGAVREALGWARATGREVEVLVIVNVARAPTKRGCDGFQTALSCSGTCMETRVQGRDLYLCATCRWAATSAEAERVRRGVA